VSKLILLLLLGILAYLIIKGFKRAAERSAQKRPPENAAERMVSCARCGVYLPQSDAIESAGRYYCCEEHRSVKQ
jgi:uncharacterized protein